MTTAGIKDIPDDVYHADKRALSQSGAKLLLPPSTPAHFRYAMDHPPKTKPAYDLGHAVHCQVLGAGPEIVVIDAADWRTGAAKAQRDAAHIDGKVPMLHKDWQIARDMADAVLTHPLAGRLLDRATGDPERSLYWQDDETPTWLRGRVDWLRQPVGGLPLTLVDLKTTRNANPRAFGKTAADFGYHRQQAHYRAGARRLLDADAAFVFVLVETEPPYLVSVVELEDEAEAIGAQQMRDAIDTYTCCAAEDHWPGYPVEVAVASLPYWYTKEYNRE